MYLMYVKAQPSTNKEFNFHNKNGVDISYTNAYIGNRNKAVCVLKDSYREISDTVRFTKKEYRYMLNSMAPWLDIILNKFDTIDISFKIGESYFRMYLIVTLDKLEDDYRVLSHLKYVVKPDFETDENWLDLKASYLQKL